MHELRIQLKKSIEEKLVPYLKKFGFAYHTSIHPYSETHDLFSFKKGTSTYIHLEHMGFHFHDMPWNLNPMLGKSGFKKLSTEYDSIPLWYWKNKIAPLESWQRDAIKLTFENYPLNSIEQIKRSIEMVQFDFENFCKDFLEDDFKKFDRIREIKYLESLVQTQVSGHYHWTGWKNFTISNKEEIE